MQKDSVLDLLLTSKLNTEEHLDTIIVRYSNIASSSNQKLVEKYYAIISNFLKELNSNHVVHFQKLLKGIYFFYSNKYQEAKIELDSLIKVGPNKKFIGAASMLLGGVNRSLGEIDLAVKQQINALRNLDGIDSYKLFLAYSYYQLGEVHLSIKEYQQALKYYEKGVDLIKGYDSPTASFRLKNGLGNCYFLLKQISKSKEFLEDAIDVSNISVAELSRGLCDLGVLHLNNSNFDTSKKYLIQSLQLRRKANLEDAASTTMIELGRLYNKSLNSSEAEKILLEALIITKNYNTKAKEVRVLNELSIAYLNQQKYQDASFSFFRYEELNQTVVSEREKSIFKLKNNQISEQKELLNEKNEILIETLNEVAKLKRSNKSLLFSIGTAITLVLLSEIFLDPIIESYSYNEAISLAVKVGIALLLKPMESLYEKILFRKVKSLKY